MKSEFDVIVVGGGGSGLAAAVSTAEHGASVLLLEKHAQLGGATGIADRDKAKVYGAGEKLSRKASSSRSASGQA